MEENFAELFPSNADLPGTRISLPYFLIGDGGFGLRNFLMTPYTRTANITNTQKIFNYRLSRARNVIECSFGLLVAKWRLLKESQSLKIETVETVIMACVCLHNYLLNSEMKMPYNQRRYVPEQVEGNSDEESDNDEDDSQALLIREELAKYFVSPEGSVPWQNDRIIPDE